MGSFGGSSENVSFCQVDFEVIDAYKMKEDSKLEFRRKCGAINLELAACEIRGRVDI